MIEEHAYTESEILGIVQLEYILHPNAILRDYYKLIFQSIYGPGHLIISRETANSFLDAELANLKHDYYPVLQDISNGNNLYRVSLSLLTQNQITKSEFLELFLNTPSLPVNWDDWSGSWNSYKPMILETYPQLNNPNEIEFCEDLVNNHIQTSHSDSFRLTYHPHYRVMLLTELDLNRHPTLKEFV